MKPAQVDLSAASKAGLGTKDAIVCLTETPLNSLAWAAYASDELKRVVTQADVPASLPLKLNTSNMFLAQIAPGMAKEFPGDAVEIQVACSSDTTGSAAPVVTFDVASRNTLDMAVAVDLTWMVRTTNEKNDSKHCTKDKTEFLCEAFTTQLKLVANASFSMSQAGGSGNISFDAKLLTLTAAWKVEDTQVGPISTAVLQSLDALVISSVIKDINGYMANNTFSVDPTVGDFSLINVAHPTLMKTAAGQSQLCFAADAKYVVGKRRN
jgi:LBP / BPI / CETP family, C-terminal domain